jgi:hypothetical protein
VDALSDTGSLHALRLLFKQFSLSPSASERCDCAAAGRKPEGRRKTSALLSVRFVDKSTRTFVPRPHGFRRRNRGSEVAVLRCERAGRDIKASR